MPIYSRLLSIPDGSHVFPASVTLSFPIGREVETLCSETCFRVSCLPKAHFSLETGKLPLCACATVYAPPPSLPRAILTVSSLGRLSGAAVQVCEGFSVELKHSSPVFLVFLFCFVSHNYNMQPKWEFSIPTEVFQELQVYKPSCMGQFPYFL